MAIIRLCFVKVEQANGASCLANYVAGWDFTILKSSVSLSVLERAAVSRRYSVNVVDLLLLATQMINAPLHPTVTRRIGVAGYITGNYCLRPRKRALTLTYPLDSYII